MKTLGLYLKFFADYWKGGGGSGVTMRLVCEDEFGPPLMRPLAVKPNKPGHD